MTAAAAPLCVQVIPGVPQGQPNLQTCVVGASAPSYWVSPVAPVALSPTDWSVVGGSLVGVLLAGASIRWAIKALLERD